MRINLGNIISETGGHGDFRMVYDLPQPFDCCGLTHTEKIGAFACKRFMEGMCNDRHITLRMEIDESLPDVKLDSSLFEQVLSLIHILRK